MYYSAYKQLFWGFFFVLFDFRIQTLDIIPDFIGFIIVFAALGKLASQHEYFGRAKPFASVLIFFSLTDLIQVPGTNLLETPVSDQVLVMMIVGQIFAIINLCMTFWICKAIYTLAQNRDFHELEEWAKNRWGIYFLISVSILVITPFLLNMPEAGRFLLILLIILGFVSALLIMGLIRRAGRELAEVQAPTS